ncbi:uncharacterized protein RAG0_12393 [Rhynchosporium agropyri]|uniref:Uncharacterized protein n=1 Tax=Rhynchosporium agropyri TaxID=914238 RepID=A0A1E1L874_9HELO|nr:uncharacterized protein RAG0_12393 [Rhynchosporium agropyri]
MSEYDKSYWIDQVVQDEQLHPSGLLIPFMGLEGAEEQLHAAHASGLSDPAPEYSSQFQNCLANPGFPNDSAADNIGLEFLSDMATDSCRPQPVLNLSLSLSVSPDPGYALDHDSEDLQVMENFEMVFYAESTLPDTYQTFAPAAVSAYSQTSVPLPPGPIHVQGQNTCAYCSKNFMRDSGRRRHNPESTVLTDPCKFAKFQAVTKDSVRALRGILVKTSLSNICTRSMQIWDMLKGFERFLWCENRVENDEFELLGLVLRVWFWNDSDGM